MIRSFLPLALVLASLVAYFVLSTGLGIYQQLPWPHLLIAGGACFWALSQAISSPSTKRRIAAITSTVFCFLLTGLYGWYTLSYSNYQTTNSVAVGEQVAALGDLELPSQEGTPTAVLAGHATLLVLYRGYW